MTKLGSKGLDTTVRPSRKRMTLCVGKIIPPRSSQRLSVPLEYARNVNLQRN